MAGSHGTSRVDPLRKLLIVAILGLVVVVVYRFRVLEPGALDHTGMFALGFVVLAGYTVGQLAEVIRLPHITGYLVAGMVLGPSFVELLPDDIRKGPLEHGILHAQVIPQLSLLDTLAMALIALTAGGELKIDALRNGFRQILGVLVGQVLTIMVGVTGFFYLISGAIPSIAMPGLDLRGSEALVLGALLASISIATSPAATIAVINGAGANGPMTRLILSSVVLKDVIVVVLFSVMGAIAGNVMGTSTVEGGLVAYLSLHVGLSLVIGVAIGGLLAAWLAYIQVEILLFLVGLVYTATWISLQVGLDPVLLFISAGFTASNFSQRGDDLIHTVEKLALPTYVVFFTLAGAKLHLDHVWLVLPYALGLVMVRTAMIYVGVRTGAIVGGADAMTRRFGWMGFVSQAGVALALSSLLGRTFPGVGSILETLAIAGIAIHELVGPVLLAIGINAAGETGTHHDPETSEEVPKHEPDTLATPTPWTAPIHERDPFEGRRTFESAALETNVSEAQLELQGLVRDLEHGCFEDFRAEGSTFLAALRTAFLQHHRKINRMVQQADEEQSMQALLRTEQTALAMSWRGPVLDRAARVVQHQPDLAVAVDSLDRWVDSLPETLDVVVESTSFAYPDDDSPLRAVARSWMRSKQFLRTTFGLGPLTRVIPLRDIAAWHFSGAAPARLEGVAAMLVDAETHLARRSQALFASIVGQYEELGERANVVDSAAMKALLFRVREQMEQEFQEAQEELTHVVLDGAMRGAVVLATVLREYEEDLGKAGTIDLPDRRRRFSKIVGERSAGLKALSQGLREARQGHAAQWRTMALELELSGLEGLLKDVVSRHTDQLARMLEGRGAVQVQRAIEGLELAIQDASKTLDAGPNSQKLQVIVDEISKRLTSASHQTERLRESLSDEQSIDPVLDELVRANARLTESYNIAPYGQERGAWKLPPPPEYLDVPLRHTVMAYTEEKVTRALGELSRKLANQVDGLSRRFEEVDRTIQFNARLAITELELAEDVRGADVVPVARELLIGTLNRLMQTLRDDLHQAETWPEQARTGVHDAILVGLDDLRRALVSGNHRALGISRIQGALDGVRLVAEAGTWERAWHTLSARAWSVSELVVGNTHAMELRRAWGLPEAPTAPRPHTSFAPPSSRAPLPLVYRRLFSDHAVDTRELLQGREHLLETARSVLQDRRSGRLRAVAVVGLPGTGKRAVIQALRRGFDAQRVIEHLADGPVDAATVESWFDGTEGRLHLVDGVRWLFSLEPNGLGPLRALVRGIIEDRGRNAWLIRMDEPTWNALVPLTAIEHALPTVVHLAPLDSEDLQRVVRARHEMSGHELAFEPGANTGERLSPLASDDAAQLRWFDSLHLASFGIIRDALNLWAASVTHIDEEGGEVRVGRVPAPPLAAIRNLEDRTLLLLRLGMRQGWLSSSLVAGAFGIGHDEAHARLAELVHLGLLHESESTYMLPDHLAGPIHRVLTERRWV